ncbi:hypothetical protein LQ938_11425 [Microbacterium sp. cx-55]|uniref:hypothetical protein n=1 Tax=Microbacterium sp. cx-55 TaxID=2875948 RepID=UPI001CBB5647|nr:hypothetical protein [Microbacterium sp. cx-55]MBZ4488114.1 hypothetical protein [Microbacterium sp. cx-55]UGB34477.1 hypothetical protein LQ938_11425 [Microbacterium sp. cx-55]
MKPENPHHEDPPERRAFFTPPGAEAQRTIDTILGRLSNPEDELRVIEGVLTHGAGFAAFLRLTDTAPEDPTLIRRYEQCYADAWNSIDDLVIDTIEALGWQAELATFKQQNGVPDDYLTWNHTAFHDRLNDMYSFVKLDGVTHAFYR